MTRAMLPAALVGLCALVVVPLGCSGDDGGGQGTGTTEATAGSSSTATGGTATSAASTSSTSSQSSGATAATTDATGTTAASTGDTGTGTTSGASTGMGSSGSSGGTTGGSVTECTGKDPGNVCGPMAGCFASSCCDFAGFCAAKDAPTCGGLIGELCPDGLVCVLDACVADAQGVCVSPETAAELEATQGTCWSFSGGKP